MVFRLFGPFWSMSYRCKVLAFWFCEIWGLTEGYNLSIFNNSAKSEANCSLLKPPPYGGGLQMTWLARVAQSSACRGLGLSSNPSIINFKRCEFYAFNSLWIWEQINCRKYFILLLSVWDDTYPFMFFSPRLKRKNKKGKGKYFWVKVSRRGQPVMVKQNGVWHFTTCWRWR